MDEVTYKSLLIVNDSSDAQVTLYLYPKWDFLCWISFESKIIKPNQKYLHRSENGFKFELVARFEDNRSKRILLGPEQWVEDKLLKITGSVVLTVGKLEDFPTEKRVCLRQFHRSKEIQTGTSGKRNLYEILGLNMVQVRKMPKEEQIKAIKKGFHREIQRWHPDKNFGDDETAKEIFAAYEILKDDEKRARYHNEADYDGGWLSLKRYKAIFKPERYSDEQKIAFKKRMMMFAASLGMTIVGIAVSAGTAGLAAPVAVALGGVFGGSFAGAGLQSLQHTVNRESVTNECDTKKWLMKAGIGFVGGAATGGAAVGITAGVAGLGSAAMESAALTAGQYIGIGAGSGAVGGVASALTSDAGRKFADGQDVTWKQVLGHAACGAAVGAAAGAAGGAVTKSLVSSQTSAATANLKGEIGEQIVILTGARRLDVLARNVSRALTENGTEAVMGSVAQFAEERLDDSVENQSPGGHLVNGAKNMAVSAAAGVAQEASCAIASHAFNEIKVRERANKWLIAPLDDEDITLGRAREELSKENNEHRVNWKSEGKYAFCYQPLDNEEPLLAEPGTRGLSTIFEDANHNESDVLDAPEDSKLRYISEGKWISKMVVSYFLDGKKSTQEGSETDKFVPVPSAAREVEVRFQVRRPFWGDILKYDPLKKCWQPHVFRYHRPPTLRTFAISGRLWYETAMEVGDETEECRFKYISEGHWTSRMIVSYFFNGNQAKQEVSGSGECVTIPSTARQVEVKFQVMRPFWGDIKKYDRFKGCWCQSNESHVFKYDTPPARRTFTISGSLWFEAVTRVSNEHHEEANEM